MTRVVDCTGRGLARHGEAVLARHVDVENRHLRPERDDHLERLVAALSFADDGQRLVLDDGRAQALADHRVIVGDEDGDLVSHVPLRSETRTSGV